MIIFRILFTLLITKSIYSAVLCKYGTVLFYWAFIISGHFLFAVLITCSCFSPQKIIKPCPPTGTGQTFSLRLGKPVLPRSFFSTSCLYHVAEYPPRFGNESAKFLFRGTYANPPKSALSTDVARLLSGSLAP